MRRSITERSRPQQRVRLWAVCVWLAVWQAASVAVGQEILLASPLAVGARLLALVRDAAFWQAVAFSMSRIALGFILAAVLGVVCAALASLAGWVRSLLQPLMAVMKATPVASIIILCLVWVKPANLSALITFLMVMPIVFTNVMEGISRADPQLLEMAAVFRVSRRKRLRYVYLSEVAPYFSAACTVSLGLGWKAGVAAEVIGIPVRSIGENLYYAKIYLDTPSLFAWTVVIILVSVLFERVFLALVRGLVRRLERM